MLMRFAICDDDPKDCEILYNLINDCRITDLEIITKRFFSGLDLLEEYCSDKRPFDVVFLDVMMPGLSGLETATQIRKIDTRVQIVFVSNSDDSGNMGEGYKVAARYLIKPIAAERLREPFEFLINHHKKSLHRLLPVKIRSDIIVLHYDDILYIVTYDHKTIIHTNDKRIYEQRRKASEFITPLLQDSFAQLSHGCIINMKYICRVSDHSVQMEDGNWLTVVRSYYGTLQKRYKNYLRSELLVSW